MKTKIDNRCCGKKLIVGEYGANRHGILMCKDCDEKNPAPLMAPYLCGDLKRENHFCGEKVNV